MDKSEQLEVSQADRDAAAWALDRAPNSQTWETLTAAHRTPDQIWQANRVAQAFARHRLATEARMAEAVEAERARCSKLAADYAASMKPTVILGDDDSIYLTDHEQGQKDAAKRLSIMIYETAIRSQSNG